MQIRLLSLLLALTLMCASSRAADGFTDNFEAAKAQAAKEGKDLLLDFTGSDWCHYCVQLRKEVFDLPEFIKVASKSFVLVELDFPNYKDQSDALKKQNQDLRRDFEINGYPTIYLCDAKGKPYARTGYRAGGPEVFLKALDELRPGKASRDDLLADAAKATGPEKAMLLDKALQVMEGYGVTVGTDDMIRSIVEADKDGAAGLKQKYELRVSVTDALKIANAGDLDGANAKLDDILKGENLKPELKQGIYYMKAQIFLGKKDTAGILAALKLAQSAAPHTSVGMELATLIPELEKQYAAEAKPH